MARAQMETQAGPQVHVVVTVEGKHDGAPANLTTQDVMVRQDDHRLRVNDWEALRGDRGGLQLWILIDDSADSGIATQFGDLRKFIESQPAEAQIGIGYLRNGTVETAQAPTADHARAAKAIRIPMGIAGGDASPYMSLSDLIKHWQPSTMRREVLMITSGIDLYYGAGPQNPYLQRAIDDAQKAGVIVHSIYWSGIGHFSHDRWQIEWGQNDLAQLSDATGGEAYWQGFINPVSFAPYLDDLARRLNNQYGLTFFAIPDKKADFQRIHISTEVPNVTLAAQRRVWVAAP
ncbi:MAG TPA: hypothetical protein VFA04_07035 [Bryobacteraceae bacterium]|nr:hypothetical protein [Bryobacteraceae bacterium]